MSFYMELRCDANGHNCNNLFGNSIYGTFRNAIAGVKTLSKASEERGWIFVKGTGHVCSNCKGTLNANAA